MKAAALLAWIGRFFFLGLFYYFLYHVYRSVIRAQQPSGTAYLIVVNRPSNPACDLWVEEHLGQKRNIPKGTAIPIQDSLKLGRATGNGLRTNDPYVSQSHFAILRGPTGYTLEDLHSTNGTYVDGVKIAATTRLTSGCEISAGSWRFRFEVT